MEMTKQQQAEGRFRVWYSLYGRLLDAELLRRAWKQVRRSHGAPGVDGQSCKAFSVNLADEIAELLYECNYSAA